MAVFVNVLGKIKILKHCDQIGVGAGDALMIETPLDGGYAKPQKNNFGKSLINSKGTRGMK